MPRVHLSKTAGARRGMTYVGVSQRTNSEDLERRQKRARRQKRTLVREANLLASSEDWRAAGEQFGSLHRRWKAAGSAGQPHEEKLWKKFRAAVDQFHQRRTKHFAELERLAKARAGEKEQLIERAQQLSSITDYGVAKGQFADLMERWRETGHAGGHESDLWERFVAARQAMYDATAQDRSSLQSDYVQRVAMRIQRHREVIGKLRSMRRELTLRRHDVTPGWVGSQMIEELDERIAGIEQSIAERETWLEQDTHKLNDAQARR
jgi:hypothetical protein